MTECEVEWIVERKNRNGVWVMYRKHSSMRDARKSLNYIKWYDPKIESQIIKKVIITESTIVA